MFFYEDKISYENLHDVVYLSLAMKVREMFGCVLLLAIGLVPGL